MTPRKTAKKIRAGKQADPLQALAGRVRALETDVAKLKETSAQGRPPTSNFDLDLSRLVERLSEQPDIPVIGVTAAAPPRRAERLATELLQEDYQRLRGDRLAKVRQSLGLSRRPWRDLLPRWLHRLLDRCGGL